MTSSPPDIATRDDIEQLVTVFYRRVFRDPLIGPIFTDVAQMDLTHHLPIICDFWETVLFRADTYRRNTLALHVALHSRSPLTAEHFARWLLLWNSAISDLFEGPVAERARVQATRISGSMLRRLDGRSGSEFESIAKRHNTGG